MYIVLEIQTYDDGTVGMINTAFEDQNLAKNKYYSVLAAAAISGLPKHTAVLLNEEGISLRHECCRAVPQDMISPDGVVEPDVDMEDDINA